MEQRKPRPLVDNDNRTFWEGVKNNKLIIQYCEDCKNHIFYPRYLCPHCFSENINWVEASGKGRIYSYTVVHRNAPPFDKETPYVVAIVELDEGVRIVSRIKGNREKISIDMPVTVIYETIDEELTLPYFELS